MELQMHTDKHRFSGMRAHRSERNFIPNSYLCLSAFICGFLLRTSQKKTKMFRKHRPAFVHLVSFCQNAEARGSYLCHSGRKLSQ